MPIVFNIRPELGAIHVICTGIVSLDEILQYETDVVADAQFDPTFSELLDLTRAEALDLDFNQVSQVVDYEKSHERYVGSRRAAFVAPKDLEFGLTRMYEMMEDESPMETCVFRDAKSACTWLELNPGDFGFDS